MQLSYLYIFGTIVFTVYGQLILKWRITEYGPLPPGFPEKVVFLLRLLLDPYILSGFASAFIASLFWMAAMTKFDISYAYPIIIAGLLIATSTGGFVLLNEPVTVTKIIGPLMIVAGASFMVMMKG